MLSGFRLDGLEKPSTNPLSLSTAFNANVCKRSMSLW